MGENPIDILSGIIIILSAAVSIVALFHRIKISPLLGYFVAGVIIGTHGLGLVQSHSVIDILGEFGIVFLLFLIGLELTFERLMSMRRHIFGLGGVQVTLTTLSITALSYFYGLNLKVSIIIGGGLALSSTAIVLQVLHEMKSTANQVGRLSVAILLLQDFAVVPLLVLVPLLVPDSSAGLLEPILQALTKAIFALIIIFITGRLLIRPFFNMVASTKNDEIFIATTLLVVLGTAYITNYFDLSMALGAFVAGLLVAETEYCNEVEKVILPFKGLLLGLFFMAIGMSIDLYMLGDNLLLIIALSILLMMLKAIVVITSCLLFKCTKSAAINVGFLLSQGGEFAFILFNLEAAQIIIPHEISQILMAVVTVTMALTPIVSNVGKRIAVYCEEKHTKNTEQVLSDDTTDIEQHVIIAGFGRVGKMVATMLSAEQINYVAIDINAELVNNEQEEGFFVYFGDINKIALLKAIRAERASAIIFAIPNELIARKAIKMVKENFPCVKIIVRVSNLSNADEYYKAGADKLVLETYEVALQLGAAALSMSGLNEMAIVALKQRLRDRKHNIEQN